MEGRGIMPLRMTIDGWQFVFPGKEVSISDPGKMERYC